MRISQSAGVPWTMLQRSPRLRWCSSYDTSVGSTKETTGVLLHVIANRLGHRDAMVTVTIYTHVRADQTESVAEIFAKAVK